MLTPRRNRRRCRRRTREELGGETPGLLSLPRESPVSRLWALSWTRRSHSGAVQLAGPRGSVAGQLVQEAAIRDRSHDLDQGPDPRILRHGIGEANLVRLLADTEKPEVSLLAGQSQADAGVGASGADGGRDAA